MANTLVEAGASVVILKASPERERGGNATYTGGFLPGPLRRARRPRADAGRGVPPGIDRIEVVLYPTSRFRTDLEMALHRGDCHPELNRMVVDQAQSALQWPHERGASWSFRVAKFHTRGTLPTDRKYTPAGGAYYHNYPAGGGLTFGTAHGRVAGRRAALEALA